MLFSLVANTRPNFGPDGGQSDPPPQSRGPLAFLFGDDLGRTGMLLFFAATLMLFAPMMVAYVLVRQRHPVWPVPGIEPPLVGFLVSTIIMLAVSFSLRGAVAAARQGHIEHLQRGVLTALGLAVVFIFSQIANWLIMFSGRIDDSTWAIAGILYFFTGIHALHVIGGMTPLVFVAIRARQGRYTPTNHAGVRYCAMYWHFIDGLWLVMFAAFAMPGVGG